MTKPDPLFDGGVFLSAFAVRVLAARIRRALKAGDCDTLPDFADADLVRAAGTALSPLIDKLERGGHML